VIVIANIKQVAAHAGLSVACVSKYLKNADSVLPTTRERIERAIKELNYVPSNMARYLRTKRTYNIKVIMESITNPFFAEIFDSLRHGFEKHGYTVILQPISKPFEISDFSAVDGIVICFAEDEGKLDALLQLAGEIPVACMHWKKPDSEIPAVWYDVSFGMALAANHLSESGCCRFAYMGGPESNRISAAKKAGAIAALEEKECRLLNDAVFHGEFVFQTGYDAAKQLVKLPELPDAVLCENDVLAAGMICGLYRQGISVPDQIRVTGFDNIPLADMYIPAITSVEISIPEMSLKTVELVLDQIEKRSVQCEKRLPKLIVRQS